MQHRRIRFRLLCYLYCVLQKGLAQIEKKEYNTYKQVL